MGRKTNLSRNLTGKVVVITGASGGIGLETAKELLDNGATVVFACRDKTKTLDLINDLKDPEKIKRSIFLPINFSKLSSITQFRELYIKELNGKKIDILINNAGIMTQAYKKSDSGIEETIQCNHIAPTMLSLVLLDQIEDFGRVINLASEAHKFTKEIPFEEMENDKNFETYKDKYYGFARYSLTKLGNIYFTQSLGDFLEHERVKVKTASLHPGTMLTSLFDNLSCFVKVLMYVLYPILWIFFKSPNRGAQTSLHLSYMGYEELKNRGYYDNCQEAGISDTASNEAYRNRFMKYTADLITTATNVENELLLNRFMNYIRNLK